MYKFVHTSIGLGIAFCVLSVPAFADFITLEARGTVASVTDPSGVLGAAAQVGDALTFDYTFDTTTAASPGIVYPSITFNSAITAASYRINSGPSHSLDLGSPNQTNIQYGIQYPGPLDESYFAQVGGYRPGAPASALGLDLSVWVSPLYAIVGTPPFVAPADGSPATLSAIPDFGRYIPINGGTLDPSGNYYIYTNMELFQDNGDRSTDLQSNITSITVVPTVPIPAALWLLGSGLFGVFAGARKRIA